MSRNLSPGRNAAGWLVSVALGMGICTAPGQEQIDRPDATAPGAADSGLVLRVRVLKSTPAPQTVLISWRRGGEGLGGQVIRGEFLSADGRPEIPLGAWTRPLAAQTVVGRPRAWEFPTITVREAVADRRKPQPLTDVAVELEFSRNGKVIRSFIEPSPRGATVGFAFPGALLAGGATDAQMAASLAGLSEYVRARRTRLEKLFDPSDALPRQFGIIGHLAGYGEGSGYGIRHCNPEILADECRCLRLLGVNGLCGRIALADAAGYGREFRVVYWGGPGAGSPINLVRKRADDESEGCPFDPVIAEQMSRSVERSIAEFKDIGARQSWALWWDEIGVAVKGHMNDCPRCHEQFRTYLRSLRVEPRDVGAAQWEQVRPYPIWPGKDRQPPATRPQDNSAEALRYYYTYRFMTWATARLFVDAARRFKEEGIFLYAMQGPTPSWAGHSLDWHEFYDTGANTAVVFETSNRDPRVWQWESYLADIAAGIARRHGMPMGCLIKPHRGAPQQRMMAVVSRGARVFEWYTYGPDYAKGDSFSQSPQLLESVGRAARFLARVEPHVFGAVPEPAEVGFVSPRASEIWGKAGELGITAFEDAKWVYLSLRHAHVPVDVLSEQQLAEGNLGRYKVLYIVGPNLRRDAAEQVARWVRGGGVLWTDALGLARDEADQTAAISTEVLGLKQRKTEMWGAVEPYRAVDLKPFVEASPPSAAEMVIEGGSVRAAVGRELLDAPVDARVVARFADGRPALIRRKAGAGEVVVCAAWAGLTYSARVRRADFDMTTDFDPAARAMIAGPALHRGVRMPATTDNPLVETVSLVNGDRRSVALINWAWRRNSGANVLVPAENLRIDLRGFDGAKSVRSAVCGQLNAKRTDGSLCVVLPRLDETDLLIMER